MQFAYKKYHSESLTDCTVLVTGGAGFIGSHLVQYLLEYGCKKVIVLDNFSSGRKDNLSHIKEQDRLQIFNGDIRDLEVCKKAVNAANCVLHQAAIGSVPLSIEDPMSTTAVNIDGFVNILFAAKEVGIKRIVYASSSAVYGDEPSATKKEELLGKPLSPYAISKLSNELYANTLAETYDLELIGLRYFNVFGPRQNPEGMYAAVIPIFLKSALLDQTLFVDGDGQQTRDFVYIENVIQANIKALFTTNKKAVNQVYNIALGEHSSINDVIQTLEKTLDKKLKVTNRPARIGDIKDSSADISKSRSLLDFKPSIDFLQGLQITLEQVKSSL